MEKLNIAEILRHCPKGMELDCTVYDNLYFDEVDTIGNIKCYIKSEDDCLTRVTFHENGCYNTISNAKCVIFPKGKTSWEGFQRPFKDGDILFVKSAYNWIFIYKESENNENLYKYAAMLGSSHSRIIYDIFPLCCKEDVSEIRLATEEEKQKLFDAIKANGYKWNPETKTLDKLIEPKFKVGDRIVRKNGITVPITITNVDSNLYYTNTENYIGCLAISEQDDWELVPNKFDITTLKPFDKVLVRRDDTDYWKPAFWGRRITRNNFPFITSYGATSQAIPFKSNEHLLGTTDNCDEYYKTW